MSQIIDGKLVSKQVRQRVKEETEKLKAKGITPGLAVIIVGDAYRLLTFSRNTITNHST